MAILSGTMPSASTIAHRVYVSNSTYQTSEDMENKLALTPWVCRTVSKMKFNLQSYTNNQTDGVLSGAMIEAWGRP
jgi:hypothetical protein